jgi:hypothetical protein
MSVRRHLAFPYLEGWIDSPSNVHDNFHPSCWEYIILVPRIFFLVEVHHYRTGFFLRFLLSLTISVVPLAESYSAKTPFGEILGIPVGSYPMKKIDECAIVIPTTVGPTS